jgi:hypothetical protein
LDYAHLNQRGLQIAPEELLKASDRHGWLMSDGAAKGSDELP